MSDVENRAGGAARRRRLDLGMSLVALGHKAGVDPKTIRSLEDGGRWPRDISRRKIERALGWTVGSLETIRDAGEPTMQGDPTERAANPSEPSTRDFIEFWNAVMASLTQHATELPFHQRNVVASQAWFELHPEMRPADGIPTDAVLFVGARKGTSK